MKEQLVTYLRTFGYFNMTRTQRQLTKKGFKNVEIWFDEFNETSLIAYEKSMPAEVTRMSKASYKFFNNLLRECITKDTAVQNEYLSRLWIDKFSRNDEGNIEWFIFLDIKFVIVKF